MLKKILTIFKKIYINDLGSWCKKLGGLQHLSFSLFKCNALAFLLDLIDEMLKPSKIFFKH